jgi:hypothetical protein
VRRGRIPIAAVAVVLLGLVGSGSALACSCVRSTPAEALARSDAAIDGRLLAVEPRGAGRAEYHYEVLRVYRGRDSIEPGSTLKVMGSRGSAACGLSERVGSRAGLFLLGRRGHWAGSLCGVIAPRRLRIAAQKSGAARASGAGPRSCAS